MLYANCFWTIGLSVFFVQLLLTIADQKSYYNQYSAKSFLFIELVLLLGGRILSDLLGSLNKLRPYISLFFLILAPSYVNDPVSTA